MSYYTERGVFIKVEGTWGVEATPTTADVVNYLMDYEAEITENKEEEFVIGGSRDSVKRVWLQREVAGALEFEPVSARAFYLALGGVLGGGVSGEGASLPCTITPTSILPGITLQREIRYPEEWLTTYGNKVDRLELTIENETGAMIAIDFAGKDGNNTDHTWMTPDIDFTLEPLTFYNSKVVRTGPGGAATLDHLRSFSIECRNDLEARFSPGAGTFVAQEIREKGLEVSGRMVIDYPFNTFATDILNRTESTITVTLGNADNGTMVITLNNVTFEGFPDAISGLDVMELDLTWMARKPSPTEYAIQVVYNNPNGGVLSDYKY